MSVSWRPDVSIKTSVDSMRSFLPPAHTAKRSTVGTAEPGNAHDAGKLACVRTSRTGSARPVVGRRHWPLLGAVVLALVLATSCSKSEFRYVSNSKINTYLKVPTDWKVYTHDDLINAEVNAAQQANQPSSLIDVLLNRSYQW